MSTQDVIMTRILSTIQANIPLNSDPRIDEGNRGVEDISSIIRGKQIVPGETKKLISDLIQSSITTNGLRIIARDKKEYNVNGISSGGRVPTNRDVIELRQSFATATRTPLNDSNKTQSQILDEFANYHNLTKYQKNEVKKIFDSALEEMNNQFLNLKVKERGYGGISIFELVMESMSSKVLEYEARINSILKEPSGGSEPLY
jgi:hypothetical protein